MVRSTFVAVALFALFQVAVGQQPPGNFPRQVYQLPPATGTAPPVPAVSTDPMAAAAGELQAVLARLERMDADHLRALQRRDKLAKNLLLLSKVHEDAADPQNKKKIAEGVEAIGQEVVALNKEIQDKRLDYLKKLVEKLNDGEFQTPEMRAALRLAKVRQDSEAR
jgi:hypothetical protein